MYFSFWKRKNHFLIANHHVLSTLHQLLMCYPLLSPGHQPKVSVGVRNRCDWHPSHHGLTKEELFFSYATHVEKVPLRELALHGCLWMNEWAKDEARAGSKLKSTDTQPTSSYYITLPLSGLETSKGAFPGQKPCAGFAGNTGIEIHRSTQKFRI